jgi:hypothetical protein
VLALDDIDIAELMAAPIHIHDGRHDDFARVPDETRHL